VKALDRIVLARAAEQANSVEKGDARFQTEWGTCIWDGGCRKRISLTHSKTNLCRQHAYEKSRGR
jgi:hypothetical protein